MVNEIDRFKKTPSGLKRMMFLALYGKFTLVHAA